MSFLPFLNLAVEFIRGGIKKENVEPASIRTILAIELNRLGDVVNILPVLKALKQHFVNAEISALVQGRFADLLSLERLVDHVVKVDSPTIWGMVKAVFSVRRQRYELVVSLSPIRKNTFVALAACSRYAVGYLDFGPRIPNFLKENRVTSVGLRIGEGWGYHKENLAETGMKILGALGFSGRNPNIALTDDRATHYDALLELSGVDTSVRYLVIHPFAGWSYREWDGDRVIELGKRILDQFPVNLVILCGRTEEHRAETIARRMQDKRRVRVFAECPIDLMVGLIRRSALFIGCDSGPIHLSAMLGTPTVGLYGPAPPGLTAPVLDQKSVIYHEYECSPCRQKRCVRPDDPCMGSITVEEVFQTVKSHLK